MIKGMNKIRYLQLISVACIIFFLIYSPHINYKYPFHIDEWRHITEANKINSGEYNNKFIALEVGIHIFLSILGKLFDLVTIYQYLPAIFAFISSTILFFLVYSMTKRYYISLFSMIFFASIKSNVNILGLWFFTPLTFCIPLIYLFIYLFYNAVEKDKPKYFIYSLIVSLIIIISHPISFTFLIPILAIYSIIRYKFFIKHWKMSLISLIVPLIGLLFFSYTHNTSMYNIFNHIIFKYGWGVKELSLKTIWVYSYYGLFLATLGMIYCIKNKKYLFILWPLITGISILLYPYLKYSIFAPYQRMIYYFALSLPILSSIGFFILFKNIQNLLDVKKLSRYGYALLFILLLTSLFFTFNGYFDIERNINLYTVIDDADYKAMQYLRSIDSTDSVVMAHTGPSTAMYPITGHKVIATNYFYGNKEITRKFFNETCENRDIMIKDHNIEYVYAKFSINCSWNMIYNDTVKIYDV